MTTIKHYLELFDGAFLVKTLRKFTGSEIKIRGSSPKIIPLNNALIHAFHSPDDVDSNAEWLGRVFEAAIGAVLSRSTGNLYYWREGKFEVDFILQSAGRIYAIEVKSGRKRSTRGLEKFMQLYPDSIPFLIDQKLGCQLLGCQDVDSFIKNFHP